MAMNQNHLFEELDGAKCGIVEKNAIADRVAFLRELLEYNRFSVVVIASPPPKTASLSAGLDAGESLAVEPLPYLPATYTVGVTDITFNPINAIFGRLLHTPDGHVVTLAYWNQKEKISRDEIPYFDDNGD